MTTVTGAHGFAAPATRDDGAEDGEVPATRDLAPTPIRHAG
jgi:hypothetical protein